MAFVETLQEPTTPLISETSMAFPSILRVIEGISPIGNERGIQETKSLWDAVSSIGTRKHIVEIGCQRGFTSMLFILAASQQRHTLSFIDPWMGETFPDLFEADLAARTWFARVRNIGIPFTLHHGRTEDIDPRQRPREIDLLYIDGSHEEREVMIDCELIEEVVPGGLVVVHDYGSFPDVGKVVDRRAERGDLKLRSLVGTMLTLEKI